MSARSKSVTRLTAPLLIAASVLLSGVGPAPAPSNNDLSYGGRLIEADGKPLAGPADIQVRFYGSQAGSDQLGTTQTFAETPLDDGVFQIQLKLDQALVSQIFGDGSQAVYVEVEAGSKVYPRQRFLAVPYALRVPIDGTTLTYGSDGALTVNPITLSVGQVEGLSTALSDKADAAALATKADAAHTHEVGDVTGLAGALAAKADANAALSGDVGGSLAATTVDRLKGVPVTAPSSGADSGKYLQYDGTGFVLSAITGASGGTVTDVTATAPLAVTDASTTPALTIARATTGVDGYLAASDFAAFSAKQPAITSGSAVNAGTVTTAQQNGVEVKPFDTGAGQTGERPTAMPCPRRTRTATR